MSIPFSDTDNRNGILQRIERELGFEFGYITGNTARLKDWTSEVNLTHDDALALIFEAGGSWQFDDINHTDDYPIISCDLISGKRDYTFTTDEQGNIILDIYRVMVANPDGTFVDILPRDQQTPNNVNSDTSSFVDGRNAVGTPSAYDKTGNGIIFNLIPNYNMRLAQEGKRGVKIFINREGSYFTIGDSTKKPGIAGLFHEYYIVSPALRHALRKTLKVASSLAQRKLLLEDAMRKHYGLRQKDVPNRLIPAIEDTK